MTFRSAASIENIQARFSDLRCEIDKYSSVLPLGDAVRQAMGDFKHSVLPVTVRLGVEEICANCGYWDDEHVKAKCLFSASNFKPSSPDPKRSSAHHVLGFPEYNRKFSFFVTV